MVKILIVRPITRNIGLTNPFIDPSAEDTDNLRLHYPEQKGGGW
jgi:hypothetical protein